MSAAEELVPVPEPEESGVRLVEDQECFAVYDESGALLDVFGDVLDAMDALRRATGRMCVRRASNQALVAVTNPRRWRR